MQSSPACKARHKGKRASRVVASRKKLRRVTYALYASNVEFTQSSLTNGLPDIFGQLSRMAGCAINKAQMCIFRNSPQ